MHILEIKQFKNIIFVTLIALAFALTIAFEYRVALLWTLGFIVILIIRKDEEMFLLFLFVNIGIGATLNLKYRYFKITISDISLVIFTLSFILYYFRSKSLININDIFKLRSTKLFMCFFLIALLFGFLHRYPFYSIFQDAKLFLYFYIPFLYLKIKNENSNNLTKKIFFIILICSILTCVLEAINFKNVGIKMMILNNFSNRDVGISIIIVPIFSCIISYMKRYKMLPLNIVLYYLLQLVFITGCIISFTRSVWLQFGLTYLVYFLFIILSNRRDVIIYIRTVIIFILIIITLNFISNLLNNIYISAVLSRFQTIKLIDLNEADTLKGRFNDSSVLIEKLKSIETIWGFGLGDNISRYDDSINTTFVENSFLYYTWKYGVFGSILLLLLIIHRTRFFFQHKKRIYKIVASSTIIFICIGNFSGNICLYYYMPIISLFLAYDFKYIKDIGNFKIII